MPLDHFVSQVHLRRFYSPSLVNRLYAISKKDMKQFSPSSKDVCRIEDGSTNAYLKEDRAVEEFLKTIEPNYNTAVEKLFDNKIDRECIYTIAGFVSYIHACSPAGMRIHSRLLQAKSEMEYFMADSQGLFPAPPPELGGMNLTEILKKGIVKIDIDPKFPQAIGITSILKNAAMFGNFKWELLHNGFADSAYFTSDFPIAIEKSVDMDVMNKIVPLSPTLAIRIRPDRQINREQADFTFANFNYQCKRLKREQVAQINRLIVRCAEEVVFFRDNHPWVVELVRRNRKYRMELRTDTTPIGNGMAMFYSETIAETPKSIGG